ncbi:MAG: A24 family peptidase [Lachnospiraceae bacterium]|nr:A24 family peptidase [Lachnospiraceae bacterium]
MTILIDYAGVAVLLFLAMRQDIRENKISNRLNVAGTVAGVLIALICPHRGLVDALLGILACFLCGLLCWNLKMFRAGDAKLLCALGAFLGWQLGLSCILYAIIVGGVLGIPLLIWRHLIQKKKEFVKIPFAVPAAIACVLCYVFGTMWNAIPAI